MIRLSFSHKALRVVLQDNSIGLPHSSCCWKMNKQQASVGVVKLTPWPPRPLLFNQGLLSVETESSHLSPWKKEQQATVLSTRISWSTPDLPPRDETEPLIQSDFQPLLLCIPCVPAGQGGILSRISSSVIQYEIKVTYGIWATLDCSCVTERASSLGYSKKSIVHIGGMH